VIMAHPRRARAAERIRASCPELDLRIVFDPDPGAPPSTLRTSMLAWASIADAATHQLVVQDDVVLCANFAEQLRAAVTAVPGRPLYLYTDWGTQCSHLLRLAALRGLSWVEAVDPWVPAQAVVLPAEIAEGFVEFAGQKPHLDDDALVLGQYLSLHAPPLVCLPNLVQHDNSPSLLGNDVWIGIRRSVCFGQADGHAITTDGAHLKSPAILPKLVSGRSFCATRPDNDRTGRWPSMPTHEWLADRGLPLTEQIELFRVADARSLGRARQGLVSLASVTLRFQFWLTGILYGVLVATWPTAGHAWLSGAFERPLARQAFATLVPGGLRQLVAEPYLDAAADIFLPLVQVATHQGLDANGDHKLLPQGE
jgi:hypothetical protein